jgi:hypothetical protein
MRLDQSKMEFEVGLSENFLEAHLSKEIDALGHGCNNQETADYLIDAVSQLPAAGG